MAQKTWIDVVFLTACLTVLFSCQRLAPTNLESQGTAVPPEPRLEGLLQDLRETTLGIMASLYQVDTKGLVFFQESDWRWPKGEELAQRIDEAMASNAQYKNKKTDDLTIEDILFLLKNPSLKRGAVPSIDISGWSFYRARLLNAAKPDRILGEIDTFYGPSVRWPEQSIIHMTENDQNGSTVDRRWKSTLSYYKSPREFLNAYNAAALPDSYRNNVAAIGTGQNLPSQLSQNWPRDKWASEGWVSEHVLVNENKDAKEINKYSLYQYQPYGLHVNFKGGDSVNFKVRATCPDTFDYKATHQLFPALELTTSIREIRDDVVTIKNNKSFKSKTAYAWIDPIILGRDPKCVVGNAVYSQDGNLYGVITGYLPEGDKELGDNLAITTVQDERMIYLFKYWYRTPDMAPVSRAPRTTAFVATKAQDRFDPAYLGQLGTDDALRWAALQRVQMDPCQTTLSPEQQCNKEFKVLRDARNRFACQTRPARPLPNRFGAAQCSMARRIVSLSCSRP
jgi:hypothetical protein